MGGRMLLTPLPHNFSQISETRMSSSTTEDFTTTPTNRFFCSFLVLFFALSVGGCASAQKRKEKLAWAEICSNAPHVAGQSIEQREQRAMTLVGAWAMSVEELDRACEKR